MTSHSCVLDVSKLVNRTMSSETAPSLLTLPSELRNSIYLHIFSPEVANAAVPYDEPRDALATALRLQKQSGQIEGGPCSSQHLRLLQTCKQIHNEANLLAISMTAFHVTGENSYPDCFALRCSSSLRDDKLAAIRHITLTAKTAHLRALNETWGGLPFGNPALDLETLTVIPKRPDTSHTAYAEVADLSQSHTLAYIFAETLKTLRNVRVVQIRNAGCFNDVVWRLVYRSLVYRIWRWGGGRCGLRFQCSGEEEENGEQWFRVWLKEGDEGSEVGEEVVRLVGGSGQMPDPNIVGF